MRPNFAIPPHLARALVENLGWTRVGSDHFYTYKTPEGTILEVPDGLSEPSMRPFLDIILDVLHSEHAIVNPFAYLAMAMQGEDVATVSAEAEGYDLGRLPIVHASSYFRYLTALIKTAIRSEAKFRPVRNVFQAVRDCERNTSYGRTSAGSFAIDVHFKLGDTPVSLGRRAWKRLNASVVYLAKVDPANVLSYEKRHKENVSADFCEALARLIDKAGVDVLKVHVLTDPIRTEDLDDAIVEVSEPFDPEKSVAAMFDVAGAIRGIKQKERVVVRGFPFEIKDRSLIEAGGARVVGLNWKKSQGNTVKLNVEVTEELYREAANANLERRQVELEGVIERRSSSWYLVDISNAEMHLSLTDTETPE